MKRSMTVALLALVLTATAAVAQQPAAKDSTAKPAATKMKHHTSHKHKATTTATTPAAKPATTKPAAVKKDTTAKP
jgi:hypothetical protein